AIQKIYELMGRGDQVEVVQFDSPHNYHQGSREAMYAYFGKTILGDSEPTHFAEKGYSPEDPSDLLSLWNRTLPDGAVDHKTFVDQRVREAEQRTASLEPSDAASLAQAQSQFKEGLSYAAMAFEPGPNFLASDLVETLPNGEKVV